MSTNQVTVRRHQQYHLYDQHAYHPPQQRDHHHTLDLDGQLIIAGIYLLLPNDRHVQHKNNLSNWGVSGYQDIVTTSISHVPTNKIFLLIKAADQVDVVFIHGLLGGVFYTWRQQDTGNSHELSDDQVREDDYQLEHNPNKKWRQYRRW